MGSDDSQWIVDRATREATEKLEASVAQGGESVTEASARAAASNAAAADHAGRNISGAFGRSADRIHTVASARHAQWNQVASTSSTKFAATYADIDRMSTVVRADVDSSLAESVRVGSAAANPELLASAILSPGTAGTAEVAIILASGSLALHSATSMGVSIVAATIVTTYELVDATLSASAVLLGAVGDGFVEGVRGATEITTATVVGLTDVAGQALAGGVSVATSAAVASAGVAGTLVEGVGDVAGAYVETAAAGVALVGTAVYALGFAIRTVGAGFLDEGVESLAESILDSFSDGSLDPWLVARDPLGALGKVIDGTSENFSLDEAWQRSFNNVDDYLRDNGPTFDAHVKSLAWALDRLGNPDGGTLYTESIFGDDSEVADGRRVDFRDKAQEALGESLPSGNIQPDSVRDLILTMGQIDAIGDKDEGVIRVMRTTDDPPAFTLVIPSTQQWGPFTHTLANDFVGNLNIINGQSALLDASRKALDAEIEAYYDEFPPDKRPSPPAVLVEGFSQGGITAGAFAEHYGKEYNVKAVLIAGAGAGNSNIDPSIQVISYQADKDLVPHATSPHPPQWETITGDNGGGWLTSHDAKSYAKMAQDTPPQNAEVLEQFMDSKSEIQDYYVRK